MWASRHLVTKPKITHFLSWKTAIFKNIFCLAWHDANIENIFKLHWVPTTHNIWAAIWDFQQYGMCDQQSLRSACAYAQSDQSLCLSLEYPMTVKLLHYWTSFGVSKLKKRLHRLIWVYTCQNATLLEISCHGYEKYWVMVPLTCLGSTR